MAGKKKFYRLKFGTESIGIQPGMSSGSDDMIEGVSVMTEGPAITHFVKDAAGNPIQLTIDKTTLEQVRDASTKFKGGVKVKSGHVSNPGAIVAYLKNLRLAVVDGANKLLADLYPFKSMPASIREAIDKIPDTIGLSADFEGQPVFAGGVALMRCQSLNGVDLVDEPSANPSGLFTKKVDSGEGDSGDDSDDDPDGDSEDESDDDDMPPDDMKSTLADIEKKHNDLLSAHTALMAAHTALAARCTALESKCNGQGAQEPSADTVKATYAKLEPEFKQLLDKRIAEVEKSSEATIRTLLSLGAKPNELPPANGGAGNAPKKPEDMTFGELIAVEFSKREENAHRTKLGVMRELIMKYPKKHEAAMAAMAGKNSKDQPLVGDLAKLPPFLTPTGAL
jgi:hypothetical protein